MWNTRLLRVDESLSVYTLRRRIKVPDEYLWGAVVSRGNSWTFDYKWEILSRVYSGQGSAEETKEGLGEVESDPVHKEDTRVVGQEWCKMRLLNKYTNRVTNTKVYPEVET